MMLISMLPEWAFFVVTMTFVLISHEVGYNFGNRRRKRPGGNPDAAAGTMSGTTLGLLAFMLAFTFNGAASDYGERKSMIIDEANAVRMAYRRSMVMPEPVRTEVRDLLREYLDIRIGLARSKGANFGQVLERSSAIQEELWSKALLFEKSVSNQAMASFFMASLNEVFNLHEKRVHALLENRIPSIICYSLFFLTFVTMAMMGYRIGLDGERSIFIEISLALAFSSVLFLIISLDRPTGIMRLSQNPLIDVQMMLR